NGAAAGHAPPAPSASTVNEDDGFATRSGFAEVPYAVIADVVVAVPHVAGFASGASAPPKKCRCRLLNGCCGLSAKGAVICPVPASGCTLPVSLMVTPSADAIRNVRYGVAAVGAPRKIPPVRWSGSNGDVIETVPSFEAFGQFASANCPSEQAPSPFATGGD